MSRAETKLKVCSKNFKMFWLDKFTSVEQLIILATVIFLTVLIAEIFDCVQLFSATNVAQYTYGYESYNGPALWKCLFPHSRGNFQSPINLSTYSAICVPTETLKPLKFSTEYYSMPHSIVAMNDGHGLIIYGCWNGNDVPTISGGPISDRFRFDSARFRWGPNEEEGSEHTINSVRYAMEVQAVHVKSDRVYGDIPEAAEDKALLCVSYLFQVTPMDNPYLEPLLRSIKNIQLPGTHCLIDPFPLCWIILPFTSKYFAYVGSLTYPPCTEGVDWLVQSETLSISSRQVKKFRKLLSVDGPLETNSRPIQDVNNRDVYFYD